MGRTPGSHHVTVAVEQRERSDGGRGLGSARGGQLKKIGENVQKRQTQRRCLINGERTVCVSERGARNLRQNTKADGHLAESQFHGRDAVAPLKPDCRKRFDLLSPRSTAQMPGHIGATRIAAQSGGVILSVPCASGDESVDDSGLA